MAGRYLFGETDPVVAPVLTAQAIESMDLVAQASGNVVRAEDIAWDTNLATTQAAYATASLGVSSQRKVATVARVAGNGSDNAVHVNTGGTYEHDLDTATTLLVGDFVGPAKAVGNALVSSTLAKVATLAAACGVVVQAGTSLTKCVWRPLPFRVPAARSA